MFSFKEVSCANDADVIEAKKARVNKNLVITDILLLGGL